MKIKNECEGEVNRQPCPALLLFIPGDLGLGPRISIQKEDVSAVSAPSALKQGRNKCDDKKMTEITGGTWLISPSDTEGKRLSPVILVPSGKTPNTVW